MHESIVSLVGKPVWDFSLVAALSSCSIEIREEVLKVSGLDEVVVELSMGPVVVKMAGEGRIRVGISWHWASDVWLGVFANLEVSPVVVQVA